MSKLNSREESTQLSLTETEAILRLRLLVARAAQQDSLGWWDDRSLTPEGDFVTGRLFPSRPRLAGAKIAMATACARHWAAIPEAERIVHLFDFGEALEAELAAAPIDEAWAPVEPIQSLEVFRGKLRSAMPYEGVYTMIAPADAAGVMEVGVVDIGTAQTVLTQASALALAYENAGAGRPVFPFLRR